MTSRIARFHLAAAAFVVLASTAGRGVSASPIARQDAPIAADSRVVSASIHAGASTASVTRAAVVTVDAGLSRVRFADLPPSIDQRTLQARIRPAAGEEGEVEVIEVEVRTVPLADPDVEGRAAGIAERLRAISDQTAALEDAAAVIAAQLTFLDAIADRSGDAAADRAGGDAFDPEVIESQLAFLATRRAALLAEARVAQREAEALAKERSALEREQGALGPAVRQRIVADVIVASTTAMSADLTIVYRAGGAAWSPVYRIRSDVGDGSARVEYEARTSQWTGEDWNDVTLELSTVDPSVPTAPPEIAPAYIDVRRPEPDLPTAARVVDSEFQAGVAGRRLQSKSGADRSLGLPTTAAAIDSGIAIAYRLPRPISLPSDRSQSQRFRIDGIDASPTFVFVSRPRTDTLPSLRATIDNDTDLVLLPGRAGIFVEGEFVGETDMPEVAGRGEFELFLGVEPRIDVVRQPVVRNSSTTGLFGGGRLITLENRIDLENRLPRPVIVELWDRRPVSRDEAIRVTIDELNRPLDQDPSYLENDLTRGLLRWTIALDAAGTADAKTSVSWTVKIAHGNDVETTPIPD